ncbi:unnamed protein product [Trichobilharzia regenti]|nr:unnamed protein product [Trichobilharzia regenti]
MLRCSDDPIKLINKMTKDLDAACINASRLSKLLANLEESQPKQMKPNFNNEPQTTSLNPITEQIKRLQSQKSIALDIVQACLFLMKRLLRKPKTSVARFTIPNIPGINPSSVYTATTTTTTTTLSSVTTTANTTTGNVPSATPMVTASRVPVSSPQRVNSNDAQTFINFRKSYVMNGDAARRLLQEICHSPLRLFTTEMLENAVACWQWLVVGRPQLIIQLLNELSDAWQTTIHRRLGVFAVHNADDGEVLPLVVSDQLKYVPAKCNTGPHHLWSQVGR